MINITQQAREMEKRLRDMLITEHSGSLVSPAESHVAYIEQQLRQREKATEERIAREFSEQVEKYFGIRALNQEEGKQ